MHMLWAAWNHLGAYEISQPLSHMQMHQLPRQWEGWGRNGRVLELEQGSVWQLEKNTYSP